MWWWCWDLPGSCPAVVVGGTSGELGYVTMWVVHVTNQYYANHRLG